MSPTAKFRPQPRTKERTMRRVNYTCSPDRYSELEYIAQKHAVSLKELLRQMVDFSLSHMDK